MTRQPLSGLYVETHGKGADTVVFIPGLGGTTRYWAEDLGALAANHRVVLIDLLGFGESPKPWTRYTVERQVAELHNVLEPLGAITLVGHSLGALLTAAYAARYPSQVLNIALIGMPYFGTQENAYRYFRSGSVKWGFLYTNVGLAMIACILTRRVFGWLLPRLLRDIPKAVAEDLVKHTWRSSTSSLWEIVYRYDAAPDLLNLNDDTGVLLIHGTDDEVAPYRAIEHLAAQAPNWRLVTLPGVDHHPFLRRPTFCSDCIVALVSGAIR